jgi:hypothetical protein
MLKMALLNGFDHGADKLKVGFEGDWLGAPACGSC